MPRTVITGAAGFIGSHLCEALLARGHAIVAIDNLITGDMANIAHLRDRLEFIRHDVTRHIEVEGEPPAIFRKAERTGAGAGEHAARIVIDQRQHVRLGTQRAGEGPRRDGRLLPDPEHDREGQLYQDVRAIRAWHNFTVSQFQISLPPPSVEVLRWR